MKGTTTEDLHDRLSRSL